MMYYTAYYELYILFVIKSTVTAPNGSVTFAIFTLCVFYVYLLMYRFINNPVWKTLLNIH